uniref:Putative lipocalin-2 1 n=1 Tax=Amblyomma cajennense TaxID=34607 RepID=A0A023FTR9_AMBCJ
MNLFALALFFALAVGTSTAQTTMEQLREALDTDERVWTVQRTFERIDDKGKHTCVYALRGTLEGNEYQFEQWYKHGERWVRHPLHGRLSQKGNNAVLTVSQEKGANGLAYKLLFWDKTRSCGILQFTDKDDDRIKCELHVWEPALRNLGSTYPCETEYEQFCGDQKYPVYTPACMYN